MKITRILNILTLLGLFLISPAGPGAAGEILYQTSTLNALLYGIYDGDLTYADLAKHGDFGLGTFNSLDGEMIALDGRFYQIKADGKAYPVATDAKTPFANVTFFRPIKVVVIDKLMDYGELERYVEALLPTINLPYAIKIEGTFPYIKARSVPRQSRPYPNLVEATKHQVIFEFKQVKGTLVGFRFPHYLKGINISGYHFHFITADRQSGGHLLDCRVQKAEVAIDKIDHFFLRLPGNVEFYTIDLSKEVQKEIDKAEK